MKPAVALAKLSPPRLSGAMTRARLFAELDRLRRQPAVWIWAPPGAGKTTLVASYVEDRKLGCLWYELDPGDSDPASFFYHLGLIRSAGARRSLPLPRFDAARSGDIESFSRGFFRELFARLSDPALLVFDNYEESETPDLTQILCCAIAQLPAHLNIAVLSRHPAPAGFAQLQASNRLALLAPQSLRLTMEESGTLSAQVGLSRTVGMRLHEEALGWAAGLRLLLEQVRRLGSVEHALDTDSLQGVFDFFAQQLFDRSPPRAQRILTELALISSPTVGMARALCKDELAGELLDHLAGRHLFVERRRIAPNWQGEEWAFRFHGLFRAFLRQQILRTHAAEGLRALAARSAKVLEDWGQCEEAMALYLQARQWSDCVRLLTALAPRMMRDGRPALLTEWVCALPPETVQADPQLMYWMGWAKTPADPGGGRAWLERAYELAAATGRQHCATQAAAAVIESIFLQYASFEPLERWLDALRGAIDAQARFDDADSELRALAALFSGTLYRRGDDVSLGPLARRIRALIPDCVNLNLKAAACTWLLSYAANMGKLDLGGQVLPLAEMLLDEPAVSPMQKSVCGYFVAWTHFSAMDTQRAQHVAGKLEALSQEPGLGHLRRFPAVIRFWLHVLDRSTAGMQAAIAEYEAAAVAAHPYDVSTLNSMCAWTALLEGRPAQGLQYARIATAVYDQAGSPWHRMFARATQAWASVELGEVASVQCLAAELRQVARHHRARLYDTYALQLEAFLAYSQERSDSCGALRALFEAAKRHGVGHPMRFLPGWLPALCAAALRQGIETGYVKSLVRTYRLPAPSADLERWPWPIRVRVLGGFQIDVDDEPVTFAAKAPRKALALLKTMICLGGREVRDHQLIDALWGEDEADGGRAAFNVTLHRLRKLLGHADAILVHEGCLTLNPQHVWVDAFAFEHLLAGGAAPSSSPEERIERALALYRGPLLPADREESWSAVARERLRAKFVHHVARRARALEETGRGDEAVALYVRGLDADGLSEVFYQGLMRCHRDAGRPAEALSLYHRFRQTLSVSLGIAPSNETEALARSIGARLERVY